MKYLLMTLLVFTLQVHAEVTDNTNKQKTVAEEIKPECGDFSQLGFKDRNDFLKFLGNLKAAKTDKDFAKLVTYPLRVNRKPKKPLIISNEHDFLQNFKEAFPERILIAIRKSEQKDNFCNYQGMTVGNGTVWIDKKNGRTGIFVINQSQNL